MPEERSGCTVLSLWPCSRALLRRECTSSAGVCSPLGPLLSECGPQTGASASPRSLLEMQIPGPHPGPSESGCAARHPDDSRAHLPLRSTDPGNFGKQVLQLPFLCALASGIFLPFNTCHNRVNCPVPCLSFPLSWKLLEGKDHIWAPNVCLVPGKVPAT